jgi:hypothetical protein
MSGDKVGNSMLGKYEYVMLALTTLGVLYLVMCQMQAAKEGFSSTYGNTQRWEGMIRTTPGFDNPPPDRFVSSMSGYEAPSWHSASYDGTNDNLAVVSADGQSGAPMVVAAPSAAAMLPVNKEGFAGNPRAYEHMSNPLDVAMSGRNIHTL